MTVQLRDASNFDAAIDFAGLAGLTHKATEGTTVVHDRYGPRLAAARDFGVPVLGAYHVVRTPGSGGNGSLASQLSFWFQYLDAKTPWWRQHPHFALQIDAERWTYDDVQPGIVLQFAGMLVAAGVPGWKITYASRGQYGDSLRGIATPLWNADYRGSSGGSYPGDTWTSYGGRPAGWAPYSGQKPVLLQYTSTPHDRNAYAGTLDELLALTSGRSTGMEWTDAGAAKLAGQKTPDPLILDLWAGEQADASLYVPGQQTRRQAQLARIEATGRQAAIDIAAFKTAIAAAQAAIAALGVLIGNGGGNVDVAAILARIDQAATDAAAARTALHDQVDQLSVELAKAYEDLHQLRTAAAAAAAAEANELGTPQS